MQAFWPTWSASGTKPPARVTAWFERNYAYDASDISNRTGAISTKTQATNDAATDKEGV